MLRLRLDLLLIPFCTLLLVAMAPDPVHAATDAQGLPHRDRAAMSEVARRLTAVTEAAGLNTVGAGLIRDGRLVWSHYAGVESHGVPAGHRTRLNVASVTKLVAAETILRLVAQERLSLDEPMAPYWVDPDIQDDPRHAQLTARMALTHATGFPNWRFMLPGGKLALLRDPGAYGYSGEGFDYVARYAQAKLGIAFPDLVREQVFEPLGIKAASIRIDRKAPAHVARPLDGESKFHGYFCRPGGWCREHGSFSAADDLLISVPEFARFLIALMTHSGYGNALAQERDRVQVSRGSERTVDCSAAADIRCPVAQGYGLGVEVLDFDQFHIIGHSGSDWSETSLAYAYLPAHDGVILFVNAPNDCATQAMPALLEALDPASPYLPKLREWAAHARIDQAKQADSCTPAAAT